MRAVAQPPRQLVLRPLPAPAAAKEGLVYDRKPGGRLPFRLSRCPRHTAPPGVAVRPRDHRIGAGAAVVDVAPGAVVVEACEIQGVRGAEPQGPVAVVLHLAPTVRVDHDAQVAPRRAEPGDDLAVTKEGSKEGGKEVRKEERKDGRKGERTNGRTEGRREGRIPSQSVYNVFTWASDTDRASAIVSKSPSLNVFTWTVALGTTRTSSYRAAGRKAAHSGVSKGQAGEP